MSTDPYVHRFTAAVVFVVLLGGACSSNTHVLRTTKGKPTTSLSTPAPVTTANTVPAATTLPTTTANTSPPPTKGAAPGPAPAPVLPATTPTGPPPPASSGRGAITGYVYKSCGNGQGSGCRVAAAGEAIQIKSGAAVAAATRTAADGSYRVDVVAGTYDVEVTRVAQSRRVMVNAGQSVAVDFSIP